MANEFQHKDPGSTLTQAEYITTDGTGHIFDSQAQGDIVYASSSTVLSRLGKSGTTTHALLNSGTNNNPAWAQIPLASAVTGTLPVANGGTGITSLASGVATFLGTSSSANLRAALTDETGSGAAVFGTSPTLVTPALGTPASGVMTNVSGTAASLKAGSVTTNANLTGPVTSSGNATAIADKALAIAKLADGTDGELITWNASGVIAAVAVGSANQVLTSNGSGAAPTFQAAAGGGKIGQVVSVTKQDTFTTTSASFVDITGLTVAITPTATSSKVLVHFSVVGSQDVDVQRASFILLRDSTAISVGTAVGSRTAISGEFAAHHNSILNGPNGGVYLDSPASTSALTYKIQARSEGTAFINRTDAYGDAANTGNFASTIVLMEVLA